ncbi:MAG TPA: hypothetical protein VJY39_22185 [Acidisphaera sp.]|nr:hypothetical protein [Acidisphaera sp.]
MQGSWKLGWADVISRIFAVIAAIFLVGAVAVAMLAPPSMPLGHVLFAVDRDWMDALQGAMRHDLPQWMSTWVISPFLLRPAWLLPASLGIVAAGLSISLSSRTRTDHARRRS